MKSYIALFAIALGACTNGVGQVDISATNAATFPGASANARDPRLAAKSVTTDAFVTLDLRKDLSSLTDLGAVSGAISKNSVSGADLAFIRHIKATIATEDGTIPEQLASNVDVPENSTEVNLPLLISDSQALEFLTEGKVILHIYLNGSLPARALELTHTIVAHMSIVVKGPIPKL